MAKINYIKFPFDKLFPIWKVCYKENITARVKLNEFDSVITKRGLLMDKTGKKIIQLTTAEMLYIKDLYESVI